MQINQMSLGSFSNSNPSLNPFAKSSETQSSAIVQNSMDVFKTSRSTQTDTVTISKQALNMIANNGNTPENTSDDHAEKGQIKNFSIFV